MTWKELMDAINSFGAEESDIVVSFHITSGAAQVPDLQVTISGEPHEQRELFVEAGS